jgi:hypothetical protein
MTRKRNRGTLAGLFGPFGAPLDYDRMADDDLLAAREHDKRKKGEHEL